MKFTVDAMARLFVAVAFLWATLAQDAHAARQVPALAWGAAHALKNDKLRQLAQLDAPQTWATSVGGTANALTVAIPNVGSLADLVGVTIRFVAPLANTSAATLTVNTLSPVAINKKTYSGLAALVSGDVVANQIYNATYDGTVFELAPAVTLPAQGTAGQVLNGTGAYGSPTGVWNALCGTTVGQIWVALSGGWGCTSLGYANPVWWGADPTGSADSTSAFNSALAASAHVEWPPGTFKLTAAVTFAYPVTVPWTESITCAGSGATTLLWTSAFGLNLNLSNARHTARVGHCRIATNQAGLLSVTSASYNSGSGVLTLNFGSAPSVVGGELVNVKGLAGSPSNNIATLNASWPVISVGGSSVTLQAYTGLGATTITAGTGTMTNTTGLWVSNSACLGEFEQNYFEDLVFNGDDNGTSHYWGNPAQTYQVSGQTWLSIKIEGLAAGGGGDLTITGPQTCGGNGASNIIDYIIGLNVFNTDVGLTMGAGVQGMFVSDANLYPRDGPAMYVAPLGGSGLTELVVTNSALIPGASGYGASLLGPVSSAIFSGDFISPPGNFTGVLANNSNINNLIVAANTIVCVSTTGVGVFTTAPYGIITGNWIAGGPGAATGCGTAIWLDGANDAVVTGNVVPSATSEALLITAGAGNLVTSNYLNGPVTIQAGSSVNDVWGNEIIGTIIDSGTGDNVGQSCSGTPTSSFKSVQGIVTHC